MTPGLTSCGSATNAHEVLGVVVEHAGRWSRAIARWVRSGPSVPRRVGPPDRVAAGARGVQEDLSPPGRRDVGVGRRDVGGLVRDPLVELGRSLGDDVEDHVGVLEAAELGALSAVAARARRPGATMWFVVPGNWSVFTWSCGTQKLWITSALSSFTRIVSPTGMWISLAVTAPLA